MFGTGVGAGAWAGLEVLALIAGIGTSALGPGGVLIPIGLFSLTHLAKGQIAGTAIVTQIGTGVVASLAYRRSDQLRDRATLRTAAILAGAAILGAPAGVLLNSAVSRGLFNVLLGVVLGVCGLAVGARARPRPVAAGPGARPDLRPGLLTTLGFVVAAISGLFGLGGPLLGVPLLIAAGLPLLSAVACAQVQSIVIAGAGTIGYVVRGEISWPLAASLVVPQLIGVMIGWRIARRVPTARLTAALAVVLIALAPYLVLR